MECNFNEIVLFCVQSLDWTKIAIEVGAVNSIKMLLHDIIAKSLCGWWWLTWQCTFAFVKSVIRFPASQRTKLRSLQLHYNHHHQPTQCSAHLLCICHLRLNHLHGRLHYETVQLTAVTRQLQNYDLINRSVEHTPSKQLRTKCLQQLNILQLQSTPAKNQTYPGLALNINKHSLIINWFCLKGCPANQFQNNN